jgi:hypothetical protein
MALAAAVGGECCPRRARTTRRWRAALDRYAAQDLARGSLRSVYGPWADEVKVHAISKIKKRISSVAK